ncbi:MAG: formylglycine-generating enzyme family protein [Desulfobulbaceae bacterium]|nr:MAG: formylglycine-generating enzyme family protein [Desulfobulbaceae bacterium]
MKNQIRFVFIISGALFVLFLAGSLSAQEGDLSATIIRVEGGCFMMGDQFDEGVADEYPVHQVCLDSFYLAKYEVTQEQWNQIMGSNPSVQNENPHYPVEVVSWYDVETFLKRLRAKTGVNYRLPSEAEWEYACRAGGKKLRFGTADGTDSVELLVHQENSEEPALHAVGSFPPNTLGLYDMSGNVSEWVQDWYHPEYYANSPVDNPVLRETRMKTRKVRRGGSWSDKGWIQRCSFRNWRKPAFRLVGLGFRLAVDGDEKIQKNTAQ